MPSQPLCSDPVPQGALHPDVRVRRGRAAPMPGQHPGRFLSLMTPRTSAFLKGRDVLPAGAPRGEAGAQWGS